MIEICFVCTGNTCRSVMAERIAKKMAKRKKLENIKFFSAGIKSEGENITENASLALKHLGYDGRNRKSVKLGIIKPNIIYVAVTDSHRSHIDSKKCISFANLAGEVEDPFEKNFQVYLETAKQIEKNIEILLNKLKNMRGEL